MELQTSTNSLSLTEDLSLELGKAHLDGAGQRAKTHSTTLIPPRWRSPMSFAPLNFYTFAAARGQFLRSDVQALLRKAPFLFSIVAADRVVRREAEALEMTGLVYCLEPRPRAERRFGFASQVVRLRP